MMRDKIVRNVVNWIINTFASKSYVRNLNLVIGTGLATLDMALEQQEKEKNDRSK